MKVALLAGGNSIHTVRWVNGLCNEGLDVSLITQHSLTEPLEKKVKVFQFPYSGNIGYFLMVPWVKKILRSIKPDVLNSHYASGYATTARLTGFRPWLLSMWGSDIYDFPEKSFFHKWLVKTNLMSADRVASTSFSMASQARIIAPGLKNISIIPFGVDLKHFRECRNLFSSIDEQKTLVVGTVKTLAPQYGIDTLILAFNSLLRRVKKFKPELSDKLRLRIVGKGPDFDKLEKLALNLGLKEICEFVGSVPHSQVPEELSKLDIYVALSRFESFGVAVIEAGAAGLPVVVSEAGGLPEVVEDRVTGFVVPIDNYHAAAEAMEKLVYDANLRIKMGVAAAKHVESKYSWGSSLKKMKDLMWETSKNKTSV